MSIDTHLAWLLDGDPAIRWQTRRDLLDEPPEAYEPDHARVATEGWAARLLEHTPRSACVALVGRVIVRTVFPCVFAPFAARPAACGHAGHRVTHANPPLRKHFPYSPHPV